MKVLYDPYFWTALAAGLCSWWYLWQWKQTIKSLRASVKHNAVLLKIIEDQKVMLDRLTGDPPYVSHDHGYRWI